MICVVIKGPTYQEAEQEISKACAYADLVELRLDHFTAIDLSAIQALRLHFSIPMIFTLRSQEQGGNKIQPEEKRLEDLTRLAALKPEYLDLESDVPPSFIAEISSRFPEIKLIISYHHFNQIPEDLEEIHQKMQKTPAFYTKIAVTPKNSVEALRFLCWAKKSSGKLIAIGMGAEGQLTRILGKVIGSPIIYSSLDEEKTSAPGQLSAQTLVERYNLRSKDTHTALYGLIGSPVDQSISDKTHNHLINALGLDALYVKMDVAPSLLADFIYWIKQLPFKGLSVTMPLKEEILSYIDHIDPKSLKIGALNTLVLVGTKISGFNTDGIGALNAIEKRGLVQGKCMVILGAGGAAKAIAQEALFRGALVTVVNRDKNKACKIADQFNCEWKGLEEMASCAAVRYDILINCTPMDCPIAPDHLLPNTLVMDIKTNPKETLLLKLAQEKGCHVIYGYEMFLEQAIGQFALWFKDSLNPFEGKKILERKTLESI